MLARNQEMKAQMPAYMEEKAVRAREVVEQKKKDQVLLETYNPWGKPGGGAPQTSTRLVAAEHTHDTQVKASLAPFGSLNS